MSNRTVIAVIVLVAMAALVMWLVNRKEKNQTLEPVLSVTAFNKTQNVTASDTNANPDDEIVYTLTAENHFDKVISGYVVEANISELAPKVTLGDAQGASYNSAISSLVWTLIDIPANGSIIKQFNLKVNALQAGSNNDVLKFKFNNELDIAVAKKVANGNVSGGAISTDGKGGYKAPKTGAGTGLIFVLALITTAIFGVYKFRRSKAN